MINCIIIDDEPPGSDMLSAYAGRISFLNLLAAFNEPLLALPYLDEQIVDLLFLDIQMPDISGLNFFKSLRKRPEVIFTTAHPEYAIQGFELNAIDYLLKPISFDRFVTASNKAKEFIEFKNNRSTVNKDFFFINASHKIHKIVYQEILYLEGFKDYTKIYFVNIPNPLLILQNLKYFEDTLPKNEFLRIHRSYMVSVSKLDTITKKSVSVGSLSMPVSDNYRDSFFTRLNSISPLYGPSRTKR